MYCGSLRRFLRKIASTFAADAAGTVIKQQLLSGKLRTKSNEPSNDQLYPNLLYGLKVYFCLWSHDVVVRQTLSDHVNHSDAHVWLRRIVASTKSDSGSRDMIDIYIFIYISIWYTLSDIQPLISWIQFLFLQNCNDEFFHLSYISQQCARDGGGRSKCDLYYRP